MEMTPYDYQQELSEKGFDVLKNNNLVYLAMEERTGKSIISLLIIEKMEEVDRVLIVTKKKALDDWQNTLDNCSWLAKKYKLANYHSVHKHQGDYSIIVLDEAHSYISGYPKRSKIWEEVKKLCLNKPIIYMSATPYAQGMQLLFNPLALSSFGVWRNYTNFYSWYRVYAKKDAKGNTDKIWLRGRSVETYKKVDEKKTYDDVKNIFITKTRGSLGFKHEPADVKHFIEMGDNVKKAYNILTKQGVLKFSVAGKRHILTAETVLKLRTSLHMLEGGVLKIDGEFIILKNTEKIDFILHNWGDTDKLVIMYQYIAEGIKLRKAFNNAIILQGTSYAEGVDLSDKDHLVIYSQDFSTAKHTQRRARQANKNRDKAINVHFLLVKGAISSQVYGAVSDNKVNYVDSLYEKEEI